MAIIADAIAAPVLPPLRFPDFPGLRLLPLHMIRVGGNEEIIVLHKETDRTLRYFPTYFA